MKQLIRLTESDLHNIVKQVINEVIDEGSITTGNHRRLLDKLKKEYDTGTNPTRTYPNKIVDNNERVQNGLKLHHSILGMDVINEIGQDAYLTFDLYMDDKLYAIFKYTLTNVKDINDKRIYLRGNVDQQGLFRNNELLLTYNIAKGTFTRPSGNRVYKFILNTNPNNPNGAHNASVMEHLLKYKDGYMKNEQPK